MELQQQIQEYQALADVIRSEFREPTMQLTEESALFYMSWLSGVDATKAYGIAYPNSKEEHRHDYARHLINKLRNPVGLYMSFRFTPEKVTRILDEATNATKIYKNGVEAPDHFIRLQALDRVGRFAGYDQPKQVNVTNTQRVVIVPQEIANKNTVVIEGDVTDTHDTKMIVPIDMNEEE